MILENFTFGVLSGLEKVVEINSLMRYNGYKRKDLNIASGTMTKMRRNEEVALSVLLRICEYLDCNIGDICDAVRTND